MNEKTQHEQARFHNQRGVIAEQYYQLQALHVLDKGKESYPLPKASYLSIIRAIFQSMEIALLNVTDLIVRATDDIKSGRFGSSAIKLSWMRGFHSIMLRLSVMPQKLGPVPGNGDYAGELSISTSPAFKAYYDGLRLFDDEVICHISRSQRTLEELIAQNSLDDNQLRIIHLMRLCNHETTIWERNLSCVFLPAEVPSYEEFVATQSMYDAVYNTVLEGDTYYTQFRGLHQIPEILSAEINDLIEQTILQLRTKNLFRAYEHLRSLNILSEGVLAALPPIADNLVTADYHNIRENLGLTSGSHSVNIHYHLFKDLYEQVWTEFATSLMGEHTSVQAEKNLQRLICEIDLKRFEGEQSFLVHLLANELLKLRTFINQWRDLHLHLPRTNLGSTYVKSLTGSSDAVQAVKKIRQVAQAKDPFQPLADARKLNTTAKSADYCPLAAYFDAPQALDRKILETTGDITKKRFQDVQERAGVFANKSPFVPPSKREV